MESLSAEEAELLLLEREAEEAEQQLSEHLGAAGGRVEPTPSHPARPAATEPSGAASAAPVAAAATLAARGGAPGGRVNRAEGMLEPPSPVSSCGSVQFPLPDMPDHGGAEDEGTGGVEAAATPVSAAAEDPGAVGSCCSATNGPAAAGPPMPMLPPLPVLPVAGAEPQPAGNLRL